MKKILLLILLIVFVGGLNAQVNPYPKWVNSGVYIGWYNEDIDGVVISPYFDWSAIDGGTVYLTAKCKDTVTLIIQGKYDLLNTSTDIEVNIDTITIINGVTTKAVTPTGYCPIIRFKVTPQSGDVDGYLYLALYNPIIDYIPSRNRIN